MKIKADLREKLGKKSKTIRLEGLVAGVVYGPKFESKPVQFERTKLRNVIKDAGYSKLVDLELEKDKFKTIFKEIQIDPVTRELIHVSLYAVDMDSEIEAEIPLHIEGKSPAIKRGIGFLETPVNSLIVKCLPGDLPSEIIVNIDELEEIGDGVTIRDLGLGDKVEVMGDHGDDFMVVFITPPQKQESLLTEVEEDEDGEEGEATEGEEGEESETDGDEAEEEKTAE